MPRMVIAIFSSRPAIKGEVIKEYFRNFLVHKSLIPPMRDGSWQVTNSAVPDWSVGIVE
jgi:hypothetical protein